MPVLKQKIYITNTLSQAKYYSISLYQSGIELHMAKSLLLSGKEKKLFFSRLIVTLSIFAGLATVQMSMFVSELKLYHYIIPIFFSSVIGSFIGWNAVLKQRLEKSNRIKSDFIASISHELRTPLTVIIGFSKIMSDMEDLNIRGHEFAQRIHLSGEHLLSFINNILDISSLESGSLQLTSQKFQLNKLIDECMMLMTPIAEEAGIKISSTKTDDDFVIEADEFRLKQVILNLLSNAIKYNKENGQVTLSIEQPDDKHYRIVIEDTGIGIPAGLHKKIFTQFERLEHHNSTIRGAGLGLSISKHLANMMGGNLDFSSKKGVGSKFWIDMPKIR